jgi:hypothetical protein
MKQILVISFLFIAFAGLSQNGYKLILLDSKAVRDTVMFGMDNSATSGVDPEFGEINIYGTTYNSLEIRSVQRDLTHHLCLSTSNYENNGVPLTFPENVDLKKDFRKFELFSPINNNFEFTINATNYPLKIITDFTQWQPIGSWGAWIGILNSNCEIISSSYGDNNKIDTIMIDNDKSVKSIIVKFDHESGVQKISESSIFQLYTNPITEKTTLVINKSNSENDIISIYTIAGNLIYSQKLNSQKSIELNKTKYKNGIYLISYTSQDGYRVARKVIIK